MTAIDENVNVSAASGAPEEGNSPGSGVASDGAAMTPARPGATIIELQDVVKVYETGAGGFTALAGVTLKVYEGEFLGIVGKSGAGKTTLLNMIAGISEISSGRVIFNERSNGDRPEERKAIAVHSLDENALALWRGRNLGIVYQSFELMPML